MTRKIIAPIAAGVLLAMAGSAQAAQRSTTFQVTANVTNNCLIEADTLDFGTFDGELDLFSSSDIRVRCTNGTAFNVNLSTGSSGSYANRTMVGPGGTLVYNLFTENTSYSTVWGDATGTTGRLGGAGAGMGSVQTLTVRGRLLASQNTGQIDTGAYSDTITATVVY
jgi:spore coat protein U-like protein